MNELKPCPFCGSPGVLYDDIDGNADRAWCINKDCPIGVDWPMPIEQWNNRPSENKLAELVKNLRLSIYGLKSLLAPYGEYTIKTVSGEPLYLADAIILSEAFGAIDEALKESE